MKKHFFDFEDGRSACLYSLRLADGFGADITDCGGCIVSLFAPDRDGKLRDVVLGWKDPAKYIKNPPFFGALVGRVPNRISNGRFELDGVTYQMVLNDRNASTLHGGFGYSHRLWNVAKATDRELVLTLTSPDGDAGFPGKLEICAVYRIKGQQECRRDEQEEIECHECEHIVDRLFLQKLSFKFRLRNIARIYELSQIDISTLHRNHDS